MRLGFCIGDDASKIEIAAKAGSDYVETCFSLLTGEEKKLADFASALEKNGICAEAANCFIPGTLKTTGPQVDNKALYAFVEKGMANAHKVGLKTVVFGSGGSRQLPEGWSYAEGIRQLAFFLKNTAAPLAEKYGLTVVAEPLYDCNIIQRVKEGVILAAMAEHERIGGLVDLFHAEKMGDTLQDITDCRGFILHAHIAKPGERTYPLEAEEYDYRGFLNALTLAGCQTCSVEASTRDFAAQAPVTMGMLKGLL